MRVIEPHQFKQVKKKKRKLPSIAVVLPIVLALFTVAYVTVGQRLIDDMTEQPAKQPPQNQDLQPVEPAVIAEPTLKTFTDEEFKELYTTFSYPNTQRLVEYPEITGNDTADQRIYELAEARGYKLSSVPVSSIVKIDEPYLTSDDLLQQNAKLGWDELSKAAQDANMPLQITSAYRSIEFQRGLFLRALKDEGISIFGITDGYSDQALQRLMNRVAPPGFSRHHNGYTIDLACDGVGLYGFRNTKCYDWLSQNNFEVAKKAGWVPSYPEEAELQGPEPEPWEFIWVGTINLYE